MTHIDQSALLRLWEIVGGDIEELAEFIGDFSEIGPELVGAMKSNVEAQDWDALRITAHSLKSNSKELGAIALADLCATLEQHSTEGKIENAKQEVELISVELVQSVSALKDLDLNGISQ